MPPEQATSAAQAPSATRAHPHGGTRRAPITIIGIQQAAAQTRRSRARHRRDSFPNVVNLGGSEVYRIAPDGSPKTIWSSKDDLVYALAFDAGRTPDRRHRQQGKLYAIRGNDYTDLTKASANQVTAFARAPKGGLYAATSNLGKVFLLGPNPVAEGTYESDVFDAKIFSKWGRARGARRAATSSSSRAAATSTIPTATGARGRRSICKELPVDAPSARFLQWKAVLHSGNPAPVDRQRDRQLPAEERRSRSRRRHGAGRERACRRQRAPATPVPRVRPTSRRSRPFLTSTPSR